MSEFGDFLKMKLIEQRRFERHGMSDNLRLPMLEGAKMVKNLNVRVPLALVCEIETLAEWMDVSKAELVTEMLESSLNEAMESLRAEGKLHAFRDANLARLQQDYGAVLEPPDEAGNRSVTFKPSPEREGAEK